MPREWVTPQTLSLRHAIAQRGRCVINEQRFWCKTQRVLHMWQQLAVTQKRGTLLICLCVDYTSKDTGYMLSLFSWLVIYNKDMLATLYDSSFSITYKIYCIARRKFIKKINKGHCNILNMLSPECLILISMLWRNLWYSLLLIHLNESFLEKHSHGSFVKGFNFNLETRNV